ncbi:MAG: ester cyclase [Acidimicrobiales bacterium]
MSDDAASFRRVPNEVFNQGNIDLIDELFSEDYVEHAAPPGVPADRDGLKAFVAGLREAFPDFHYEVLQQVQDGDTHVGYIRATGTMKGDFMGMPASGKSAAWDEMHIGRYSNGQIAEHWAVIDALGMMTQLGFIPENPGG